MRNYIIRRLLLTIPTLLLVSLIVFFAMRMIPGDIIDQMVEDRFSFGADTKAALEASLGLDAPVHIQFVRWLGVWPDGEGNYDGIFQGSLGNSLWMRTPVLDEIVNRLPVTTELALGGMFVVIIISLPIGITSAIRQDTAADYVGRGWATLLIALPNFWVGLMIILLASLWLGISPPLAPISLWKDPIGNLGQFAVPAFIMGMQGAGTAMRMTRSMMLEVLRQDYVRTAWAKGLKERVIIVRHALKNALIPIVTIIGLRWRTMIGGTVIVETVFLLPGVGRLLVESTNSRDYTMVSGVIFCIAIFMVLVNLTVDLTYGYLDPRVHYK